MKVFNGIGAIAALTITLLCHNVIKAQTYVLNGALNGSTITTCSGLFTDSGGASGNYSANENYTVTFCPDGDECLTIDFLTFQTESGWDFLTVYDGPNASSPVLGSFSGNGGPGSITRNNCLTFVFTSDGSFHQSGWQAEISCGECPVWGDAAGCPRIDLGPDFDVLCHDNCVTLEADVLETGLTTTYSVEPIDYDPPFPFDEGIGFSIGTDDVWSSALTLPFNFCFFGGTFNQVVVGSNGVMSFNTNYANGYCDWQFSQTVPNSNLPVNSIFGIYHDIDPSVCGSARYAILGEAPCRMFVLNFDNVCHYSCNSLKSTSQVVLYETTNIIEVYVKDKPTCSSWNSGNAVIGIQNANGTQGYVAPGRQTGSWSASNEAWRFLPDGDPNFEVTWFDSDNNPIGTGMSLDVCVPPTGTFYHAEVLYTSCDGSLIAETDTVHIGIDLQLETEVETTPCYDPCDATITIHPQEGDPPYTYDIGDGPQLENTFTGLCPGEYVIIVVDSFGCTDSVHINIDLPDFPYAGLDNAITVCENDEPFDMISHLNGDPDANGVWTDADNNPIVDIFDPATGLSGDYTYTVGEGECANAATLSIEIAPVTTEETEVFICEGESHTLPDGEVVSAEGVYESTILSVVTGCDSIVMTTLGVNPVFETAVDDVICITGDYTLPDGQVVTAPGVYETLLQSVITGCDSTIVTSLTQITGYETVVEVALCGNDSIQLADGTYASEANTYEVLLTSVQGCDSLIITHVEVITVDAGIYNPTCHELMMMQINGSSNPVDAEASFTWSGPDEVTFNSPNNATTVVTVDQPGFYIVELTDSRCPDDPALAELHFMEPPQVEITPIDFICMGETATASLILEGNYADQFIWQDSLGLFNQVNDSEILINTQNFAEGLVPYNNYEVTVLVMGEAPCPSATATMMFDVINCEVVIPDIFTPNGDGVNDMFEITGISSFQNSRLIVLNRWGKVVYESDNYGWPYWNGTHHKSGAELADGVYYYELILGRTNEAFQGTITIVRD